MTVKDTIDKAFHDAVSICEAGLIDKANEFYADNLHSGKKFDPAAVTEMLLANLKESL